LTFIETMKDNPKFNRKRFLIACGIETDSLIFDDGYEEVMGYWTKKDNDPYDTSDPENVIEVSPDHPASGCRMMAAILA